MPAYLTWTEVKLLAREPLVLVVSLMFPILLMVLLLASFSGDNDPVFVGLNGTDFYVTSYLGAAIAATLVPQAKAMLVAIALVLAALELAVLRAPRAPSEPTRAFGAAALVLSAAQLSAATSFIVFALAAALAAPWLAAAGGAVGSGAVLTAAWSAGGEWERGLPLRSLRLGMAGLLFLAAVVTGLSARGLL